MDQVLKLQVKIKLLKEKQVEDKTLNHPVEVSFNDFKPSSDSILPAFLNCVWVCLSGFFLIFFFFCCCLGVWFVCLFV